MTTLLCIGGPQDGKWLAGVGHYMKAFTGDQPETDEAGHIITVTYVRTPLRSSWKRREVWAIDTMTPDEVAAEAQRRRLL